MALLFRLFFFGCVFSFVAACNAQGCPVYVWSSSVWSSCPVACGGGTQTRQVVCKDQATGTAVENSKCTGTPPTTSQPCNTAACPPAPIPHTWVQGSGSPCSKSCGGGQQTFTPKCYRTDTNVVVDDSVCADQTKPATSGSCNTAECPTYWSSGAWSVCSAKCGPSGVQTRSVGCYYSTDDVNTATPLPDSKCSGTKPASSAACNTFACPSQQAHAHHMRASELPALVAHWLLPAHALLFSPPLVQLGNPPPIGLHAVLRAIPDRNRGRLPVNVTTAPLPRIPSAPVRSLRRLNERAKLFHARTGTARCGPIAPSPARTVRGPDSRIVR
jgi:hypothetical protein